MRTLLSVIIVSYNTKKETKQTLESVVAEVARSANLQKKTEILVVDNASSDGSIEMLTTFKKNNTLPITLIKNKKNVGFGVANNQALEKSTAKYVVFLNSDTIVQPGGLSKVIHSFESVKNPEVTSELDSYGDTLDRIGIIAPTLLNSDGSIQPQGGSTPTLATLLVHMFFLDDIPFIGSFLPSTQHTGKSNYHSQLQEKDTTLMPIDWVGGTALFARTDMLDEIGPFDKNIFMYGEDIELCMRAKKHHWDVAIHTEAQVTHLQNASSSSKNAIVGELTGYKYLWSKHKPLWQLDFALFLLSVGALLRYVLYDVFIPDSHKASAYKEALRRVRTK